MTRRSAHTREAAARAAEGDKALRPTPEIESCPVCGGILEHTIGCPEHDKPR